MTEPKTIKVTCYGGGAPGASGGTPCVNAGRAQTTAERPLQAEIAKFIEMFERLDAFESYQRHIRGYGAFRQEETPDTSTIKVIAWLKELRDGN